MANYHQRAVVVVSALLLAVPQAMPAANDAVGHASTHLVVRARPGVKPALVVATGRPTLQAARAASAKPSRELAATLEAWGVTAIQPLFEGFANPQLARQLGQ